MSTVTELAAEYFPGESESFLDAMIWNETGFPCFWHERHGSTPTECMRFQLADARHRLETCQRLTGDDFMEQI